MSFTNIVKTTDEFRSLSPKKRNCLYPKEKHLDFFPEYSETSCVLECAWSRAARECGCVPWFLRGHFPDRPMCELTGNACFRSIVDDR